MILRIYTILSFLGINSVGTDAAHKSRLEDRRQARNRSLRMALLTTILARMSGVLLQVVSLPIAAMQIGAAGFSIYAILGSLLAAMTLSNLVYTEHARRHLLSEGCHHRRIYLTGSPMREVLEHYRDRIQASDILSRLNLKDRGYFIVSLHREENVDSAVRLTALLDALNQIAEKYDMPIIVSTHPRTRKRLEALQGLTLDSRVQWMKPFGFHDYNKLQMRAFCAISDSGTIAEESSMLGFPAITPRDAIERPEGLDVGCILMTGLDTSVILQGVDAVTRLFAERNENGQPKPIPADYCISNTSERVTFLILGTAKLSNAWDGIRRNDLG